MRMGGGPGDLGREAVGRLRDATDLQPAEDDVQLGCLAHEAEPTANLLGSPKAAEEKEEISLLYFVAAQVTLRGAGLPEDRTPSRGARDRIAAQIRIEMRAVVAPDSAAGQVFDDLRD